MGRGRYTLATAPGGEREPPAPRFAGWPVPTHRWFASLLFDNGAQPLYAQPASYRFDPAGFQVDQPQPEPVYNASREENDIVAAHRPTLAIRPTAFPLATARVVRYSDWAVDLAMGSGDDTLAVTVAHGSPYSFYAVSRGDVRITTAAAYQVFFRSADGRVLGLSVGDRAFAVYAPAGARWQTGSEQVLDLILPAGRRHFTVAALPAPVAAHAEALRPYAFAVITDTRVEWEYDEQRSELITRYRVKTERRDETGAAAAGRTAASRTGDGGATVLALYPHHWHDNPALPAPLPFSYATVRGELKPIVASRFQTRYRYRGFVPAWPGLTDVAARRRLDRHLAEDLQFGAEHVLGNRGTYWEGKGLNRAVQLMNVAAAQGRDAERRALLAAIKGRLEKWFAPQEGGPYFHYHAGLGTLIGYPDEYGSANELNDHHFHYGYWIFAAAQVALQDPAWARRENWGGMVEQLIGDIANADPRERKFPRLRHFDVYEGHAWASGTAPFYDGNNQESSSEAVNAWAALILWGEATGNRRLRDTGIYLYTTEIEALRHYWFDVHRHVFPADYRNAGAGIVWGGKYVHTTWWTENPREVLGINLLPITTASVYLGAYPEALQRNLAATDADFARFRARGGRAPQDIWQDILLAAAALADAPAATGAVPALAAWNPEGAVEDGETRSHTWHWLASLAAWGRVDPEVSADCALYSVFRHPDGRRTYLAYNAATSPRLVTFSDGTRLRVPPRRLAQLQRSAP